MVMKRISKIFLLFVLAATFFCQKESQIQPVSLIFNSWITDVLKIDAFWKEISGDDNLKKIFVSEPLNRLFDKRNFHCHLRFEGVAHQAMVVKDEQSYSLKLTIPENARLKFSVFNYLDSELRFDVYVKTRKHRYLLYAGRAQKSISRLAEVNLKKFAGQGVELILKTSGRGLGAWVNPCLLTEEDSPQTVIILVYDTLRHSNLSLYGYERETAPVLQELAKESEVYQQAFSTTSWTLPAHVSLFSGLELTGHGVIAPQNRIRGETPLITELLQKNGFLTVALTGGGFVKDTYGFFRGFQLYSNRASDIFQIEAAGLLFRHFKSYLENYSSQNWFIFLHTYQQHAPYKAPSPYRTAFNKELKLNLTGVGSFLHLPEELFQPLSQEQRQQLVDLYDGSILYSDQELLKPLIDFLKAKQRWNNTLLVVLSDHGEEFYEHQGWEHGHTLYDELIRIPLVVRYPQNKNGGRRIEQPFSIKDVWKIIYQNCKLKHGYWDNLFHSQSEYLTAALPLIPTFDGLLARVSFIKGKQRYIHNFVEQLDQKKFPALSDLKREELFALTDFLSQENLAELKKNELPGFRKLLQHYLNQLAALKSETMQLDAETRKQLKALGYLND